MNTSVLYYCAFAIVVISTAMFGLDWQPAALSPMAPVKVVAFAPPPPVAPVKAVTPNASPTLAAPAKPATPNLATPNPVAPALAPVAAPPKPESSKPESSKPLCDVAACAAAYRSFRESDCTYNPSFGERRLCTKGVVPAEAGAAPAAPPDTALPSIIQTEPGKQPNTPSTGQCNVSACAAAYRSFRESDCTFNPSFGPRQVCTK